MDRCMICLEECDTYALTYVCDCKMICHHFCLQKWIDESRKCMICKREIEKKKNRQRKINDVLNNTIVMRVFRGIISIITEWVSHCSYIISNTRHKTHFCLKLSIILVMSFTFFIFFIVPLLSLLEVSLSITKIKILFFDSWKENVEQDDQDEYKMIKIGL